MNKISNMKVGDVFYFANGRTCTLELIPTMAGPGELRITSLSDGWQGLFEHYKDKECSPPISMPTTPLELIRFIKEHQIQCDHGEDYD